MASIFRRNGARKGKWLAKFLNADGQYETLSTRTTDHAAAERIADKWESDAVLRREGAIDASVEKLARQGRRPIAEHLDDFKVALMAKGATARHVELVIGRATRVVKGCKFETWADVSASKAMAFLHDLRLDKKQEGETVKRGISAQTFNFYVQAIQQFGRWMVRDNRAAANPLSHLDKLNIRLDRRHDRRAFTAEELRTLLQAAENGAECYGMTGKERSMLYRLAVETGLRAGELRSLTAASFNLTSKPPTVTVAAAYSKRRRDDTLPLRPATAKLLTEYLKNKMPDATAFKLPVRWEVVRMFREDLKAAGIAEQDASDRFADFHALRHSFISNLAAGGVHPKTAQALARHSTITLTMDRYTHRQTGGEVEALAVLPDLSLPPAQIGTLRATGTDNGTADEGNGAHHRAHQTRRGSKRHGAINVDGTDAHASAIGQAEDAQRPLENADENAMMLVGATTCGTEAEGFEPPDDLRRLRFSRPVQ